MSNYSNKEKKPVTKDPRFSSVHNDPRFLRPKKKDMKVTIDKRFASMMNSAEFSNAPRVDKYGRKIKQDTAEKQLKRYYKMEEEDDDEDSEEEKTLEELEKELAEDEENLRDELIPTGYDPMRGRGEISSSESDDESDDEDLESEPDEMDSIQRIQEGDETSRLALVNMDWDKLKAVDILKALNGFKPDTGIIKSVTIYPSEFGKERLASEEVHGPPKDIFKKKEESDSEDDEEITEESIIKNQLEEGDGRDFDQEALRKYQLERLKYYYAVVECDSPQTAKVIYKTCDNTEYESSANFFDLRYVPEDMPFDDEVKDKATVVPDNYAPTKFTTEALQRTKVTLTWDEDDVDRYRVTRRDFTQDDLKDIDFDSYLASSDDDEEEEDVEALKEKYRKLLQSNKGSAYEDQVDEDEDEGDMEITFTPGLSEAAGAAVANKQDDEEGKEETSIEKYMRKVKEKKKAKKSNKQQPQVSKQEEDDSDIDAETENDPYFKEAMSEMATEGFVDTKDNDKKKKKRASKEEREQKARERAELELLMGDDAKDEGFNMKDVLKKEKMEKKKKKNKEKKEELPEDDFNIDVNDPRFAAIQDSHHFAIDPTNPQYKKTKSMKKLLDARHTKMKQDNAGKDEWKKNTAKPEKDSKSSLQQLVASVKRKGGLKDNAGSGKRQKN